jgi:hypothetical protein
MNIKNKNEVCPNPILVFKLYGVGNKGERENMR